MEYGDEDRAEKFGREAEKSSEIVHTCHVWCAQEGENCPRAMALRDDLAKPHRLAWICTPRSREAAGTLHGSRRLRSGRQRPLDGGVTPQRACERGERAGSGVDAPAESNRAQGRAPPPAHTSRGWNWRLARPVRATAGTSRAFPRALSRTCLTAAQQRRPRVRERARTQQHIWSCAAAQTKRMGSEH